ncbi:MAG TPA: TonB C-terminal domain-containing protein [Acidobacteriaceae bacterium]|nr:TonB C-terminal domain-containing protein [Acidobacteriaceae bacterium]
MPHESDGAVEATPVRIRTGRYGELNEHELIHLLSSIEDERARSRFRESVYLSIFIWLAIAWVVLYGPKYLWHAPKMVTPFEVLNRRELTRLTNPILSPHMAAPRPAAPPKIDSRTLEHLRSMERAPAPKTPPPAAMKTPETAPAPAPPMTSSAPPAPSPVLPLPSAPQPVTPKTPPPVVAEAPTPQPSSHPTFNSGSTYSHPSYTEAPSTTSGGGRSGRAASGESPLHMGGVDVLSDTQGVNFDPYIRRLIADIYRNWLPLIPEEAKPPLSKQGETLIRFSILPDGHIGAMHLDGSTHDDAINRSCWGSITSEGQFPPLPSQFHGPNLELRIHYFVNKQPE